MKPLEEMGKFATVVVDPPWDIHWSMKDRKHSNSGIIQDEFVMYPQMTLEEIAALPIGLTLADNARLFVWTIQRYLPHTYALIANWGVEYELTMTWVKTGYLINKPVGKPFYNSEWCIVGRKGRPEFIDTVAFNIANSWPAVGHSIKPEGFYDLLRRVTPGPRLDIFGRRRIAGFTSWGNEAPEGDPLPDYYQEVML